MRKELEFSQELEKVSKIPWAETGKKLDTWDRWEATKYKGKWIDLYTDPEYIYDHFSSKIIENLEKRKFKLDQNIHIADLGGGEASLANIIKDQLERKGYKNITAINVDLSEKSLRLAKDKYPEILELKADVLKELPFKNSSLDFIVSRRLIYQFSKENQSSFLKSVYRKLKPEGLAIITWPGVKEKDKKERNEFLNKLLAIITEKSPKCYRPTQKEVKEIAKETGFKILSCQFSNAEHRLSPQSYNQKFKLSPKKFKQVKKTFQQGKKNYPFLDFIEEKGGTYLHTFDSLCIFKKPK